MGYHLPRAHEESKSREETNKMAKHLFYFNMQSMVRQFAKKIELHKKAIHCSIILTPIDWHFATKKVTWCENLQNLFGYWIGRWKLSRRLGPWAQWRVNSLINMGMIFARRMCTSWKALRADGRDWKGSRCQAGRVPVSSSQRMNWKSFSSQNLHQVSFG